MPNVWTSRVLGQLPRCATPTLPLRPIHPIAAAT
jgi:hypothetical protein